MARPWIGSLLLVVGLLAGCRGAQGVFLFRPLQPAYSAGPASLPEPGPNGLVLPPAQLPASSVASRPAALPAPGPTGTVTRLRRAKVAVLARRPLSARAALPPSSRQPVPHLSSLTRDRKHPYPFRRLRAGSALPDASASVGQGRPVSDTAYFLTGLGLVVGGLLLGFSIGGWLGLLLGLALGVPGYLLLGRGYAGGWQAVARPRLPGRLRWTSGLQSVLLALAGVGVLGAGMALGAGLVALVGVLGIVLGASGLIRCRPVPQ
ncbi:hypothetical protein [Hymenobacter metallilatus]|uniref:Uncharacterized protein n=1 Tax=Hymenobacter metallilatus TaxID=2493666 RepID=A0A428JTV5_9BACT|nr:hypothetical protein [Hymenobacter metallilatus]RSK37402.1 hypothetical protein EI290_01755 [Hymenobacter metallilatus]